MPQDFYYLKRENNPLREDAFTLSCLGKLHPASSKDFLRCRTYLSTLIQDSEVNHNSTQDQILIIGLTESGIIPALLMYIETLERNLQTSILYSTRRPLSGIAFKESHSHGPDHILPLPLLSHYQLSNLPENISPYRTSTLHNNIKTRDSLPFKEIWIVEDEITSGNTVYNLMVQLCKYLKVSRVRIFAFADFRDSRQQSDFAVKTSLHKIECSVHTLNTIGQYPNSTFLDSKIMDNFTEHNGYINPSFPKNIKRPNCPNKNNNNIKNRELTIFNSSQISTFKNWHLPSKRPALAIKSGNFLDPALWKLTPDNISSEWRESKKSEEKVILVVGEAIDLAASLALSNDNIRFQQISLSPWRVDNRSIFSKISFADRYYLYNYEYLKNCNLNPLFILCDPIDQDIEQEAILKLGEHGIDVKPIFKSESYLESGVCKINEQC